MWGVIWIFMSAPLSMHIRLFLHAHWCRVNIHIATKDIWGGGDGGGGATTTTTLAIFFIIANELARQRFLHERLYDMGPGTARKGTPPPPPPHLRRSTMRRHWIGMPHRS